MSKTNKKYYYRAEIWFADKGGVMGDKRDNFEDCIPQLIHFMNGYATNRVVSAKIQKYSADGKEFKL